MVDFTRLDAVRQRRPLIHCVNNIVTANDCANLALAVGASPMMAQAAEEMAEITAISDATVLNTGTPSVEKFQACLLCGIEGGHRGQPVILDPVGVGASSWRLRWAGELLAAFTPAILRVNLGEARALLRLDGGEHGVDSLKTADREERLTAARKLAARCHTTVLLSGPEDVVTNGGNAAIVSGGSGLMSQVTGAGCMLSVLCGAFAAVTPSAMEAAVLASLFWKACSRRAEERAGQGIGSFHMALLDAASTMTAAELEQEAAPLILENP